MKTAKCMVWVLMAVLAVSALSPAAYACGGGKGGHAEGHEEKSE